MGKRKERRLAALSNAGRRVKLDLFAEPSGDAVDSSVHHEVTGGLEQNGRTVVSMSPSSGTQSENPLLLLGQYTDNELAEEENVIVKSASSGSASDEHNVQVEVSGIIHDDCKGVTADVVDKIEILGGDLAAVRSTVNNEINETEGTADPGEENSVQLLEQSLVSGDSRTQIVGDVTNGWKLVIHEESNQYYYWNTVTGETSWEVPHVLLEVVDQNGTKKVPFPEESETGCPGPNSMDPILNEKSYLHSHAPASNGPPNNTDVLSVADGMHEGGSGMKMVADVNNNEQCEVLTPGFSNLTEPSNPGEDNYLHEDSNVTSGVEGSGKHLNLPSTKEDIPARLVKFGESLLQRLWALQESDESIRKYIMEVEIRLSDCKVLSSYGLTLLPFWWHIETQLKQLESIICGTEVFQSGKPELNRAGSQTEVDEKDKGVIHCNIEKAVSSKKMEHSIQKAEDEAINDSAISVSEHLSSEDMDMDVDMDVDDENSLKQNASEDAESLSCSTSSQMPTLSNPNPLSPKPEFAVPVSEFSVPPPPEEDWIPPPPPDNEPPPPPPPDEPTDFSYPVPYPEVLPYLPFGGYNLSFVGSGCEYYAPMTTISSSSCYAPLEVSQVADPQQTFYEPAGLFPTATQAIVNPVDSATYYNLSNENAPSEVVVNNLDSSGFYSDLGAVGDQDKVKSDQVGSGGVSIVHGRSELPNDPGMVTKSVSCTPVTEPATMTAVEDHSAIDPPGTATSNQPKVMRTKKRTISVAPTLRSNKKVSSLVDKWKAAKEELKEDEKDEPENSYEMLEKKKQREIEEWRAQQISSGQALENANFQPLGGDWRERVRRKKAEVRQSTSDAIQTSETVSNGKLQPDLVELSQNLPSGWQAYWDEQTNQVYYGNVLTSETTWTRPT